MKLVDHNDNPLQNVGFALSLPNGPAKGTTDKDGMIIHDKAPKGKEVKIELDGYRFLEEVKIKTGPKKGIIRGEKVTFSLPKAKASNLNITGWKYVLIDSTGSEINNERTTDVGSYTWSGKLVKSGTLYVEYERSNERKVKCKKKKLERTYQVTKEATVTLEEKIKVEPRKGKKWNGPTVKLMNVKTVIPPKHQDVDGGFVDPPEADKKAGFYASELTYKFLAERIQAGPNEGLAFVTGWDGPPKALGYPYIHPKIYNEKSKFLKDQIGDYLAFIEGEKGWKRVKDHEKYFDIKKKIKQGKEQCELELKKGMDDEKLKEFYEKYDVDPTQGYRTQCDKIISGKVLRKRVFMHEHTDQKFSHHANFKKATQALNLKKYAESLVTLSTSSSYEDDLNSLLEERQTEIMRSQGTHKVVDMQETKKSGKVEFLKDLDFEESIQIDENGKHLGDIWYNAPDKPP